MVHSGKCVDWQLVDDDTVSNGCERQMKGLFQSPGLNLDLRFHTHSSDDAVKRPEIEFKVKDLSERGLLGPAISAEFELDEGQAVYIVLREIGDFEYSNEEHEKAANPGPRRAEMLGVSMDKLLDATSKLRPKMNPMLTHVSRPNLHNDMGNVADLP